MTKQEVFAAIKNLVSTPEKVEEVKFERVALEGGEVFITNQTEGELALGDTIYVEEGSEFILSPAGTHRVEDGREIVLDEESKIVEIKEESEVEEEEVVEDEVVVETDVGVPNGEGITATVEGCLADLIETRRFVDVEGLDVVDQQLHRSCWGHNELEIGVLEAFSQASLLRRRPAQRDQAGVQIEER